MIKFQQILCPTDLSPESDEGLRYAAALACAYDAKLDLLYCGNDETALAMKSGDNVHGQTKGLFENSIAAYCRVADRPAWEGIVVGHQGDPGEEIVRVAAERSVDLIVMRSRRRPRAAALLGSTAERVYRTAPCPVLVTHEREREWVSLTTGEIALGRILVAHDFSNDSELALQYALSLAQEYQAELHLLHVLSRPDLDGPEIAWGPASFESAYNAAVRRLQDAITDETVLLPNVVHAVRWGKPYQEILAYAKELEIDLVCIGAKGRNFGLGALFGSNVDRVLRQAPCPVLVTRPLRPAAPSPKR
jgi:nucleotide-binding universal stress UspA family protein